MALGLCISFLDLSTRRNIEQTPSDYCKLAYPIPAELVYFFCSSCFQFILLSSSYELKFPLLSPSMYVCSPHFRLFILIPSSLVIPYNAVMQNIVNIRVQITYVNAVQLYVLYVFSVYMLCSEYIRVLQLASVRDFHMKRAAECWCSQTE
jgi:hypothetical protein